MQAALQRGMYRISLLAILLSLGCGAPPAGGSVEDDLVTDSGISPGSVFQLSGAPGAAGDLVYLQFAAGGRFAWTRCASLPCADPAREDGTWKLARGSRRSLRFFLRGRAQDPSFHFHSAYFFSVSRDGSRLWLRGEAAGRSFQMEKVAEAALCEKSGGSWRGIACDCGKGWPTAYSPGAGGCWQSPAVTEQSCDATQGTWTDDDPALIGTYCVCGIGRRLSQEGCVDDPH